MPTHRTSPDNRQDPIVLKNLVSKAGQQLQKGGGKPEIDAVTKRLEKLLSSIDFRSTLDGLALFVNPGFAQSVYLPFSLQKRVVVDKSFFIRDLVYAMNRTPRYWVLVLSEKPTRLFEATRDDLVEIRQGGFPMTHEGPGGSEPLPGGFGVKKSAYRDEYHRKFFRAVDSALDAFLTSERMPILVVGVDRYLAFFRKVSRHNELVLATLQGSHDQTSPHELGCLVWPLIKAKMAEERIMELDALEKAVGERNSVSGVGEVWRLAKAGRGRVLLVEEGFHFPAKADKNGRVIRPMEGGDPSNGMDDAVDEIIDMMLRTQGKVVFLKDGMLAKHQRIALILRY